MTREAFRLYGKILVGTATTRDRERLAHLTQNKADKLKMSESPLSSRNRAGKSGRISVFNDAEGRE